jgi:aminoglycoside 6'-N-acetyltransferase
VAIEPGPTLEGERLRLRPLDAGDVARIAEILAEPAVARWYSDGDPRESAEELLSDTDAFAYAVEVGGEVAGSIQFYEETTAQYRHAGLDIFLTTARQGQGLGPEALRVLGRYLLDERGHHRLVIDPAADNERAIHAYESVGFRPVGVMRRYERGPDGTFHDGLLMDLLAGELS